MAACAVNVTSVGVSLHGSECGVRRTNSVLVMSTDSSSMMVQQQGGFASVASTIN